MLIDHWMLIDRETDEVVMEGTVNECVEETGVKEVYDLPDNLHMKRPEHMSLNAQEQSWGEEE